ncbi:SNO glutamine amidotransferase [Laetiporus sulphureus 93-53]|uniref:glutaminase n=1 Tax=Laetiporus sulphureus 93-53 TaxID=1314785 RepID=A0A165ILA6_9APHY|nr:SNO glutamine amidotransferase [Laetiporus sulphureus 93-53]KZT13240.1 SNO glutamine amidotransferase [Laetiporus sulphureus 93-53]
MQQTENSLDVAIGILAMQGAFAEHQVMLQKLSLKRHIVIVLVRTSEDLARCDALIIPGGESTTIALLARLAGLLGPLREFVKKKPVWGTCAGAILLAQAAEGTKKGGQELLGGMSVTVCRNGWGSQVESFEAPLEVESLRDPDRPFHGVFIRAPVVLSLNPSPTDPPMQIISRISTSLLPHSQTIVPSDEDDTDPRDPRTIVALRQGRHLLTSFHPELTKDDRFHEYFVRECVLSSLS